MISAIVTAAVVLWGYFTDLPGVFIFLSALFAFVLALWLIRGTTWIFDRRRRKLLESQRNDGGQAQEENPPLVPISDPAQQIYDEINQHAIRDRIRITELIEYVGLDRSPNPPTPLQNATHDFVTELRQALSDGAIRAWGKPRKHYPPIDDPHGKPTEEIPSTFWRESCIFALNVFVDWEKISTMPDNALASGASEDDTYTLLELDLSQVKARFARNAWLPILENFEKYGTREIPKS
ncbi:MAG: hypothetical protein ACTSX7_02080 [Alphaproteobacteria bacterium]